MRLRISGPSGGCTFVFAKALGNETGRPTRLLDVGSLMGSLVGQSEANPETDARTKEAVAGWHYGRGMGYEY